MKIGSFFFCVNEMKKRNVGRNTRRNVVDCFHKRHLVGVGMTLSIV